MDHERSDDGHEPIAHTNVVLFRARSHAELDRIVAREELRGLVWRRLDATRALIDSTMARVFFERLEALGFQAAVGDRAPQTDDRASAPGAP